MINIDSKNEADERLDEFESLKIISLNACGLLVGLDSPRFRTSDIN